MDRLLVSLICAVVILAATALGLLLNALIHERGG